ncbi:unannotated protein [freshwater metagenome]|uniref:Unannotated protein n=1 Tax=freshwater metagenome TaxID=449393 RepID=A0A6J6CY38_9ZZZZ
MIACLTPCNDAARSAGRIPGTDLILPSRVSSPSTTASPSLSNVISSAAASRESAIAQSNAEPRLGRAAGESARVIRLLGHCADELMIAERTRSRASESAASGRPRSVKPGTPFPISASTSIKCPDSPTKEIARVVASIKQSALCDG